MKKPIYPTIEITDGMIGAAGQTDTMDVVSIQTYIRKQGADGRWYLTFYKKDTTTSERDLLRQVIAEIYIIQTLSIVKNNVTDDFGNGNWVLDFDQRSERERLYNSTV